jgi:hypothetical protein
MSIMFMRDMELTMDRSVTKKLETYFYDIMIFSKIIDEHDQIKKNPKKASKSKFDY